MSASFLRRQHPDRGACLGLLPVLCLVSDSAGALDNPLDYDGSHFLGLYVPLMLASLVLAMLLRRWLRLPGPDPRHQPRLDVYETAYLAGGAGRTVDTALAVMALRGEIGVSPDGLRLQACGRPQLRDPIERKVFGALTLEGRPPGLHRRVRPVLCAELDARLRPQGLLPTPVQAAMVRLLPAACTGSVLLLGLLKLAIGLSRHRPVGFLVVCCLVLGIATLVLLLKAVPRSRHGDAVLKQLRSGLSARTVESRQDPRLALVMALFGVAAVAHLLPEDLAEQLAPAGSGGGDSGSGSDGSDSGGGDSGGDSGGGGCGGCGGGGGD